MQKQIFLTGATGFIGASLLQTWLDRSDAIVAVLSRAKHDVAPGERVKAALREIYPEASMPKLLERVRVVEGDVSQEKLGLRPGDYENLISVTSHVIHCAAAVRFDLEIEDARRENVGGTRNVLDFARSCGRLRRMDYVGTAYVAGKRTGVIREDELDKSQQHNNTYERTKLEAEKLVRDSAASLPVTILRPSIVVCDSKTGRASNHNGFYRALSLYWRDTLKVVPGHPETCMDLVPVDYVADAAYSIAAAHEPAGRCYHLAAGAERAARLGEIQDLASFHFGKKKFKIVSPEEFDEFIESRRDTFTEEERDMIEEVMLYMPYTTGELTFDTSNATKDIGLTVPRVETYFGVMAGYVMTHS